MRILFQEESTDIERYQFQNDDIFKQYALEIINAIGLVETPRERCCITTMLPYPRTNIHFSIAYYLGNIPWITYADTAEFIESDLTRYFLCYPPVVLIGNKETLTKASLLSESCFPKLKATISVSEKVKIGQCKSYFWSARLTRNGIIQHVE